MTLWTPPIVRDTSITPRNVSTLVALFGFLAPPADRLVVASFAHTMLEFLEASVAHWTTSARRFLERLEGVQNVNGFDFVHSEHESILLQFVHWLQVSTMQVH